MGFNEQKLAIWDSVKSVRVRVKVIWDLANWNLVKWTKTSYP